MRRYKAAIVFTDSPDYPSFADTPSDFVYARLMRCESAIETGYTSKALDLWAKRVTTWAEGGRPSDLRHVEEASAASRPRDVFVFFISGAKERAPAAARALLERLQKA